MTVSPVSRTRQASSQGGGGCTPATGPKGPHFCNQHPTFRVQSVKVKDGYTDDMFSQWDSNKEEINLFIEHANSSYPTIKFMAEISQNKTTLISSTLPITCIKGNDSETIYSWHSYTLQAN